MRNKDIALNATAFWYDFERNDGESWESVDDRNTVQSNDTYIGKGAKLWW